MSTAFLAALSLAFKRKAAALRDDNQERNVSTKKEMIVLGRTPAQVLDVRVAQTADDIGRDLEAMAKEQAS